MNDEAIKPCPFCGGEGVMHFYNDLYWIECPSCGYTAFLEQPSADVAVALWNNRPLEDRLEPVPYGIHPSKYGNGIIDYGDGRLATYIPRSQTIKASVALPDGWVLMRPRKEPAP